LGAIPRQRHHRVDAPEIDLKRFFSEFFGVVNNLRNGYTHLNSRVIVIVVLTSSSVPASRRAKRATILLVDDDPFQAFGHRSALDGHYASIERAVDASEALIRVEEPGVAETLALIVVGLRLPGMAGPAFVSELSARAPRVPILVIGRIGETPADYGEANVQFLPSDPTAEQLLAAVKAALSKWLRLVA
jgi:CheY-like chemotaxis protein